MSATVVVVFTLVAVLSVLLVMLVEVLSIRRGSRVSGSGELESEDWPDFGDQPPR